MTDAIAKGSAHNRETAEDDLRAAQHRQVDLVAKLGDIRADYGKQLSGCDMARSLTLGRERCYRLGEAQLGGRFYSGACQSGLYE